MVSLKSIKKAVISAIQTAIDDTEFKNVKIISEEVKEPILRPAIRVIADNTTFGKFNANNTERQCYFEIYFFAENEHKYIKDNLKMRQILELTFLEDLKIEEGFFVPVESVDCETSDTVIVCRIKLYMIELLPDTDMSEPMEEIKYKEDL